MAAAITRPARQLIAVGVVLVLVVGAAIAALPVLLMMGSAGLLSGEESAADGAGSCLPTAEAGGRTITLDDSQLQNAGVIIRTGASLDVPARGLVVAIATALQESVLRNLDYGDRDSVGLFQQRAGWGSFEQRTDPPTSAKMFYTGGVAGQPGLLDIEGWRSMSITIAAQAVQRSAFPNAYAKWEPLATSLVRSVMGNVELGCTDAVSVSLPTGAVGTMLRAALAQQGDPYVWGAVGPDAFDCSGLVVWSWRQAGYRLNVRTADQMYDISTPLRAGEEKPGDLLFGSFSGSHAGTGNAGHVMIVVRPGVAVQAPSTGDVVKISNYEADGVKWRLGRLPSSALRPLQGASAA